MSENLNTALSLMGTGMLTVFVVLTLVIIVGKGLIWFVNNFVSEVKGQASSNGAHTIDPKKLAAITSAVEIVTQGNGRITHIKKID